MTPDEKAKTKIQDWTRSPVQFVSEVFDLDGTPGKRISEQQREGLEMYRRLIMAKLKASRGISLTPQEGRLFTPQRTERVPVWPKPFIPFPLPGRRTR